MHETPSTPVSAWAGRDPGAIEDRFASIGGDRVGGDEVHHEIVGLFGAEDRHPGLHVGPDLLTLGQCVSQCIELQLVSHVVEGGRNASLVTELGLVIRGEPSEGFGGRPPDVGSRMAGDAVQAGHGVRHGEIGGERLFEGGDVRDQLVEQASLGRGESVVRSGRRDFLGEASAARDQRGQWCDVREFAEFRHLRDMAGAASGLGETHHPSLHRRFVDLERAPGGCEDGGVTEEGLGGNRLSSDPGSAPGKGEGFAAGGFEESDVDGVPPGVERGGSSLHGVAVDPAVVDDRFPIDLESGAIIRGEIEVPDAGRRNLDLAREAKAESVLADVRSDAGYRDSNRVDGAADLLDGAHAVEVAIEVVELQSRSGSDREHAVTRQQIGGEGRCFVAGQVERGHSSAGVHRQRVGQIGREASVGPGRRQIFESDGVRRIDSMAGGASDRLPEGGALRDLNGGGLHRCGDGIDRASLAHQEVDEVLDRGSFFSWLEPVKKVGHPEAELTAMSAESSPNALW